MNWVRVKFCGMQRREDVEHAVRLGADYVGFVFVPGSRRQLQAEEAARLMHGIAWGNTQRVGVFRDQPLVFVGDLVQRLGLDLVQLHGHEPRDYARTLPVPALRVLYVRAGEPVMPWAPETNVFGVLLDAADASGRSGGHGTLPDAAAFAAMIAAVPANTPVIVAGGLTPENVGDVVRRHRPWGVDVSSGIEARLGVKDPARMAAFLTAVGRRASS